MATQLMVIENPSFNLPVLSSPSEIIAVMKENLEGTAPRFERVKIPSGGGLAFELPGEGDQPEITQEIVGVVLDHYAVNAYWSAKYSGQGNPPDCSALNAKAGEGNPGGNCATCPMNQWGTAVDQYGNPTAGKACKNIHRLYILREGEVFPLLLALPPTSLGNFTHYMARLTSKLRPFYGCVTKVKLQKAQNRNGIVYSQATFTKLVDLSKEEIMAIRQYAEQLRNTMRSVAIEATDYDVAEPPMVVTETTETEPF